MCFICPDCLNSGSLEILESLQLPADERSDDITIQIIACENCRFRGLAIYEESRRGSWDEDTFEHSGYRLDAVKLEELIALIRRCPNPKDASCRCGTHQLLGLTDLFGRWKGLERFDLTKTFPMRLAG